MNYQAPIRIELPTIFGMKTVNAYLFTEPEPVLIDCGEKTDLSREALSQFLRGYGLNITDLRKLVITHAHVDHMGLAGDICAAGDVQVFLPRRALPWAIDLQHMRQVRLELITKTLEEYEVPRDAYLYTTFLKVFSAFHEVWDPIPASRITCFDEGDFLAMGGKDWEVLYTPGHCVNQCCFYEKDSGHLISADMLLSMTPTPVIEPRLDQPTLRVKGLPEMLQSYEKISQFSVSTAFPGHYAPIHHVSETITKQLQRIEARKLRVLSLIQAGKIRAHDLFEALYKRNFAGWPMLLGYLDLLEIDGLIHLKPEEGVIKIQEV